MGIQILAVQAGPITLAPVAHFIFDDDEFQDRAGATSSDWTRAPSRIDNGCMNSLNPEQAKAFCDRWLPAWSGNQPDRLAAFYSEDCFYADPGVPDGLQGREALLGYFRKLLAYNPDWVWTHREAIPMQDGFVNMWHAHIPVGDTAVEVDGVCLVQLDADGLIYRNEVYFDRSELLQVMARVHD